MRAGRAASKARLAKPREPGDDPAGPSEPRKEPLMDLMPRPVAPCLLALLLAAFTPTASAGVIHVPADYASVQEAIDHAANFDTIFIAAGTFAGPILNGDK